MDWTQLINLGMKNGIWALLFVCLFIWTMSENKAREKALQEIINKVNDNVLTGVNNTESKVEDIDIKLDDVDAKVDSLDRKVDGLIIKVDGLDKRI